MKNIIFIILTFLIAYTSVAQNVDLEWVHGIGGTTGDIGNTVALDSSGNVIVSGYFEDVVDFDPGPGSANLTSGGGRDVFIAKYDGAGNYIWAIRLEGTDNSFGYNLATNAAGDIYISGWFQGTVDFDPDTSFISFTSSGSNDIFIAKYDANGNLLWAHGFGDFSDDRAVSLAIDTEENIYITGTFEETVDFDPGPGTVTLSSIGETDLYFAKYDSNGNFQWVKSIGEDDDDGGHSLALDSDGNIYLSGSFEGLVDFDPGPGTANLNSPLGPDFFFGKYDNNGNYLWAHVIENTDGNLSTDIAVDENGNTYLTGPYYGNVDLDPGVGIAEVTYAGGHDMFLAKYDTAGNYLWAHGLGGPGYDWPRFIKVKPGGIVYVTGKFEDSVDFDPDTTTAFLSASATSDAFIAKYDSLGNYIWAAALGGDSYDGGYGLEIDDNDNVYNIGTFRGTLDYQPDTGFVNLLTNGGDDIFIAKFSQNICVATTSTNVVTSCISYTWINGLTYTSDNNTDTYTLTNADGCDSIISLDLTINSVNTALIVDHPTITADVAGATYKWLQCPDMAVIPGETGPSYTATASGSFAVEITEGGCTDTSSCIFVTTARATLLTDADWPLIYPHPSDSGFIVLAGDNSGSAMITMTDINGDAIAFSTITERNVIHLQIDEPAGVYVLYITLDDKNAVRKLIQE